MKVICTLENASDLINGVRFVSHADGMISEDLAADVAENFTSINGYKLVSDKPVAAPVQPPVAAPAAAPVAAPVAPAPAPAPVADKPVDAPADKPADQVDQAADKPVDQANDKPADVPQKSADELAMEDLRARAAALELRVDARWKLERLKAEVEKAEKARPAA